MLERYPKVEIAHVDALMFEMADPYFRDRLVVFIQDPQNPNIYWHRRIGEFKSHRVSERRGQGRGSYQLYPIEPHDRIPVTEKTLPGAVQGVLDGEDQMSNHPDPKVRKFTASVAIAKYGGSNVLSLEQILDLVAFRYVRLRAVKRN